MKHSILCYLFGHVWRRITAGEDEFTAYSTPCDYCKRCGLSKEEVFKK